MKLIVRPSRQWDQIYNEPDMPLIPAIFTVPRCSLNAITIGAYNCPFHICKIDLNLRKGQWFTVDLRQQWSVVETAKIVAWYGCNGHFLNACRTLLWHPPCNPLILRGCNKMLNLHLCDPLINIRKYLNFQTMKWLPFSLYTASQCYNNSTVRCRYNAVKHIGWCHQFQHDQHIYWIDGNL